MPAPLSIDLRQRVIAAYQAKEGSQRQLAERFKVSLSFVRDLTCRYRSYWYSRAKTTWWWSGCETGKRTVADCASVSRGST